MQKKLISIIIPVYNHAHTLRRCFKAIEKQTYRPLEVIVVNDGSSDNFAEELEKAKKELSVNLKVVNQKNHGAPFARNRGFENSSGELVIFWDADTVAKSNMLQKLASALEKNPQCSYAYSRFRFGFKKMKCHKFDSTLLKHINYIDTTSLLRREDFCGFDENLKRFQDWDLWLTLLEKNKIGIFVSKVLFKKITVGRKGISNWLPKLAYSFNFDRVKSYNEAKEKILEKHGIRN